MTPTTLHAPALGQRVAPTPITLRRIRERLGLTQLEVAISAGLTPATVSRLENGHQAPNLATVHALAVALHTTVETLLDGPFREALRPSRRRV